MLCLLLAACSATSSREEWQSAKFAFAFLEKTGAKSVYFNGAVWSEALQIKPGWLQPEDHAAGSEHLRSLAQAALSPKLFRQLDRQERFDALLLAGDPVQFRALSEHLQKTQDWSLEWVDAWCSVYRRQKGGGLSKEAVLDIAKRWDQAAPKVRAAALAAMSERLVAAFNLDAAWEVLQIAKLAHEKCAAVWTAEGTYRLARGEWTQAVAAADRALKVGGRDRAARSVKAQGLYFSKHYEEAYELSRALLDEAPEDPVMLFTHAKISHEVRALQEETRLLRKLIDIAERERRPTSWYRVYLGQALAMTGDGPGALAEFDLALGDSELPEDQREFAKSARARVALRVKPGVATGGTE
ncbi:MAG: hypothetical protein EBS01_12800 [Verrucomicrobia bacterium]|nr:hypothetical protein [Verrucomicrobiota bacterium]